MPDVLHPDASVRLGFDTVWETRPHGRERTTTRDFPEASLVSIPALVREAVVPSSHVIWNRARANCLAYKKQFQRAQPRERAYAKLDLDDIFHLLDSASSSARAKIIEIKGLMCRRHWSVTATIHEGGFGEDAELHFNILFRGAQSEPRYHFHLRCKALPDETVVIFDVTERRDA